MKYIVKICLIGCVFVVLGISCTELGRTIKYIDLTYFIENFDSNSTRITEFLPVYATRSEEILNDGECRSDILQAATGIVLADLDRANPDNNYLSWSVSAARAERVLAHAKNCAPFVSDYWIRYAMVLRSSGEEANSQAFFAKRAVELDPSSAAGLRSRFVLWRKFDDQTLIAASPVLTKDLDTLLTYASPQFIRDVLKGAKQPLMIYVVSRATRLSKEKVTRLIRLGVLPPTDAR